MPRNITSAAETAATAKSGYHAANLVQLSFDSTVRAIAIAGRTPYAISGTISASADDNSFNGSSLFADVIGGDWIDVSGFVDGRCNGLFRVSQKVSDSKVIIDSARIPTEAGTSNEEIAGPYQPDTLIEWTEAGTRGEIKVETSIDNGTSWQPCENGGPIPNIKIGDALFSRQLFCRQTFNLHDANGGEIAPRLRSVHVRIIMDDGATIERTENTLAEMEAGILDSVVVEADGTVRPRKAVALHNTAGGNVRADGANVDALNISKGEEYDVALHGSTGGETSATWQAERYTNVGDSAFTVEMMATFNDPVLGWAPLLAYRVSSQSLGAGTNNFFQYFGGFIQRGGFELRREGQKLAAYFREWGPRGIDVENADVPVIDNRVAMNVATIEATREYHIVAVYDGQFAALWVNGESVARKFMPNAVIETRGTLLLGQPTNAFETVDGDPPAFDGHFREIRLWGRALSDAEISLRSITANRTMSDAEVTTETERGLAAYWRCDDSDIDGSLDEIEDQTGRGNTLRVFGADFTVLSTAGGQEFAGERLPYRVSPPLDMTAMDNIVRLTNAPFDVTWDGKTFLGVGRLGKIETISEPGDMEAAALKLSLSGLIPSYVSTALQIPYLGRPIEVYTVFFTVSTGALVADPVMTFKGSMDTMPIALGETATVSVTAESHMIEWRRPSMSRWSDRDQRARSVNDSGFELAARVADKETWWPGKTEF